MGFSLGGGIGGSGSRGRRLGAEARGRRALERAADGGACRADARSADLRLMTCDYCSTFAPAMPGAMVVPVWFQKIDARVSVANARWPEMPVATGCASAK